MALNDSRHSTSSDRQTYDVCRAATGKTTAESVATSHYHMVSDRQMWVFNLGFVSLNFMSFHCGVLATQILKQCIRSDNCTLPF